MNLIGQQKNEAFSIATLLYTRLRKVSSRVIDVMYFIENKEYAKYILGLAMATADQDLMKYAGRLTSLLALDLVENTLSIESEIVVHDNDDARSTAPTDEEIYRAQVSHHYIGALR